MKEEKTEAELLREKLFMKKDHAALRVSEAELAKAMSFAEGYKSFINDNKTEREVARFVAAEAEKRGFVPFDRSKKYAPGDKVYYINRKKAAVLAVMGRRPVADGVRIAAAHIDSPRLDLKPSPLYESNEIAYFKTHYYGGIKKYQWTVIPLSLHGIIIRRDGTEVEVSLGEKEGEPQFVISDLLPHLAKEQEKRTLEDGIKGEELNIIIGSLPFKSDSGSELVKLNIMKLLNEKYGMTEEDFLTAELEMVPAMKVTDVGFDRSLVGGYGHDDRVCAYPELMAALDLDSAPEYTAVAVLTDKEETGSDGNTGLCSLYLKNFIADLARAEGLEDRDVLSKSKCLSADVNAAFDPSFPTPFEANNAASINRGVVVTKYTGARGKSGTSDANAEYVGEVTRIFNAADVCWQMGELGAVDAGGGGTVAKYIANLDVDVVDLGVPVLSMHAPYELIAKLDVYMAYKAVSAFFKAE